MAKKDTSDFREHLVNVDRKGKRVWLFPKIIKGKFYRWRTWFSWVLLLFLFAAPWLRWNHHPLFLFQVLERKFIVFGIPFWPQDLYLLALGLITFMVFIIAFTAVFGRVFCGWACPQTIFMEMVFRKIENWIEGSPAQQKKLREQPWNSEKIIKLGGKNLIFWVISFMISNTFLAYIIGTDSLLKIMTDPVGKHFAGLIAIVIFTTIFYLVFARIRELVCIMICPYGRLQGVLMDSQSVVVGYDYRRGEPRGKLQKSGNAGQENGDCVDCGLCIDVCPTGIDIRNGTQLECVHCTACIDACDSVMVKIGKAEGLIRYASGNELKGGSRFRFTTRIAAYAAIWMILFIVFVTAVAMRKDLQTSIFRQKGETWIEKGNGEIQNTFDLKFVNKTFHKMNLSIECSNTKLKTLILADDLSVSSGEMKTARLIVFMNSKDITRNTTPFEIIVKNNGVVVNRVTDKFLGPVFD